ncbi:MAG TPA: DUF885 family protein, partial [Xanthomonadales bacterium]|nr:DUF885 family protein [Xanthomonadales bacterium]
MNRAQTADAELEALLAEDWRDDRIRHPIAASLDGDRSAAGRWDDQSEPALAAEAEHRRAVLTRLDSIPRESLSEAARLNAELYAGQLRDALRGYELGAHFFALDPREGVQTYAHYAEQMPFADRADYESWLARLDAYPRAVADTIALLRAAVARKLLWPRASMERLPAQLDRLLTEPERSPFFEPFARIPASVSA